MKISMVSVVWIKSFMKIISRLLVSISNNVFCF